jgi:hypothetical protein
LRTCNEIKNPHRKLASKRIYFKCFHFFYSKDIWYPWVYIRCLVRLDHCSSSNMLSRAALFLVCFSLYIFYASSLEPLTTLRIVNLGINCISKTSAHRCSKITSIVFKGRVQRILPSLKCAKLLGVVCKGGAGRIMLGASRHVQIESVMHFLHVEEIHQPLWMCILLDVFMDSI